MGIIFGNMVTIYIGGGKFLIPWLWIIVGLLISTIVGVLSGYIPAKKAAALDPIEAPKRVIKPIVKPPILR